ncbi:YgjV family protein [Limibacter armeniacum]|uniref:YgjV family protein n=1 Tax=Limibacter armeniacum TaxID=466084 RepID=UPI002FE6C217
MNLEMLTEILGYLASALVMASFLMKDIQLLRMINILGCAFFVIYGFMGGYLPVILTNSVIIVVNFYQISKINRRHYADDGPTA